MAEKNTHQMDALFRVHLLHSQLDAAIALAKKSDDLELKNIDFFSEHSPYMQKLADFYQTEMLLAMLRDAEEDASHLEQVEINLSREGKKAYAQVSRMLERGGHRLQDLLTDGKLLLEAHKCRFVGIKSLAEILRYAYFQAEPVERICLRRTAEVVLAALGEQLKH